MVVIHDDITRFFKKRVRLQKQQFPKQTRKSVRDLFFAQGLLTQKEMSNVQDRHSCSQRRRDKALPQDLIESGKRPDIVLVLPLFWWS